MGEVRAAAAGECERRVQELGGEASALRAALADAEVVLHAKEEWCSLLLL